jgi:hypothetical protein
MQSIKSPGHTEPSTGFYTRTEENAEKAGSNAGQCHCRRALVRGTFWGTNWHATAIVPNAFLKIMSRNFFPYIDLQPSERFKFAICPPLQTVFYVAFYPRLLPQSLPLFSHAFQCKRLQEIKSLTSEVPSGLRKETGIGADPSSRSYISGSTGL